MTIVFHTDLNTKNRGFNITWKLCGVGEKHTCVLYENTAFPSFPIFIENSREA